MKSFFISSTFRDMQEERDIIHRIVFPAVRNRLKKYGESVEEIDLRWGVDTLNLSEEESGHLVIRVCIDAIDRCVPYFIVLLGERYGWIPEKRLFDTIQDKRLTEIGNDISITEMEILYGALNRELPKDHCIFCFRNASFISKIPEEFRKDFMAESRKHQEKSNQLKARIRNLENVNILDYDADWDFVNNKVCGLESFAEKLENILINLLMTDGLHEEILSTNELITKNAELTMQQYVNTYITRAKIEEFLPIMYASKKHQWFSGESGSGKTAFLSYAATQSRQHGITSRIYYGGNPGCENVDVFLHWLSYELEKICNKTLEEEHYTRRLSIKKIQNLSKILPENILIFVDAVNQMSKDTLWVFSQLISSTTNIQFVLSSVDKLWDTELKDAQESFASRKIEVLTNAELELVIAKIAGRRGKSLDAKVTKKIREKDEMHLPINVSLLLQRLFMMDGNEFTLAEAMAPGMTGISMYMQKLIDSLSEKPEELVASVINKAMECMNLEKQVGDVKEILGMIAAAPEGISLRMLSALYPTVTMLQIQQLLFFLYDMLEESEDGRWRFKHPLFSQYIKKLFGNLYIRNCQEKLYQTMILDKTFRWNERIILGKSLKKYDLASDIAYGLKKGELTESQIWNFMNDEDQEENYYLLLAKHSKEDTYYQCILRGIFLEEITPSNCIVDFVKETTEQEFSDKKTLFYLYGAKNIIYNAFSQYKEADEYLEKQYEIYLQITEPSKNIVWEMAEICMNECCSYEISSAKKWYERLTEVERYFAKYFQDTNRYIILNSAIVWYWRFLKYEESNSQEDLLELKKFADSQYSLYKVQDNLNLYEQENPGYNERNMKFLAVLCRNLSSLYLNLKDYPKAFPYAKAAYEEAKKAYQLSRTFKTAALYARTSINMMQCVKNEYKDQYFKEAIQALAWMESKYFCANVGERLHFLFVERAKNLNSLKMWENALETAKRLGDDEWLLYDYRMHKNLLRTEFGQHRFEELLKDLTEIESLTNKLYRLTKDEYFIDLLHEWSLDMTDTYTMHEQFNIAEHYLQKNEEYLQCAYIQKGKMRWHREMLTATAGIILYYRNGEKEKLSAYMTRTEKLLKSEERNKSTTRKNMALLWEGRLKYMYARMYWDETHDIYAAKPILDEYFEKFSGILDENELRPGYLLLGELEYAAGNNNHAIIHLERVRMRDSKKMPWNSELHLSEYQIWQYIMAAKASILLYDITGDSKFAAAGIKAFTSILSTYTRNQNAIYRNVAGQYLAEYFIKCIDILSPVIKVKTADILLIWMKSLAPKRELLKEEYNLTGECLIFRDQNDPKKYSTEDDQVYEWLLLQKEKWPQNLAWSDRINRILMKKALWNCICQAYENALQITEMIQYGKNTKWNEEKDILLELCKLKCSITTEMSPDCEIVFKTYIENAEKKNSLEPLEFCLYIELLILTGDYDLEQGHHYYRKAAKLMEEKFSKTDKNNVTLLKKLLTLYEKCVNSFAVHMDQNIYIEDCKAARNAFAQSTGFDKEELIQLLKWDVKIAHAYKGIDPLKEFRQWQWVANILSTNLIKKELLTKAELESCIDFSRMCLEKLLALDKYEYRDISIFLTLPKEILTELYVLTNDTKWLDEALNALEVYRELFKRPELNESRKYFITEKTAESYLYDMDIYWLYLKTDRSNTIIDKLVSTGQQWAAVIPAYYKELNNHAIGAFKEIDELLEGSSLNVKALVQTLTLLREGDSNEIYWFIKTVFENQGTDIGFEELQKLYQQERLKNQDDV